jgi:hypothetical protein
MTTSPTQTRVPLRLQLADWDTLPDGGRLRAIQAQRGRVKVGSFPGDDTTMMVLQLASGRRLRLQVVQGDAEPVAAHAAMDAAAAGQATSASA